MASRLKKASRKALTRLRGERVDKSADVPGPTPNPASNLILADVAMRMGSYVLRGAVQRSFLKGRYGKKTAKNIVKNRSIGQTLASVAIAKFATRSVPGAVIVTSGMAAKVLLDRSRARHAAKAEGDEELLEQSRGE